MPTDTITVTAFGIIITATPYLIKIAPSVDSVRIDGRYLIDHWEVTILDTVTKHHIIGEALGEIINAIRYFTVDKTLNSHANI